MQEVMQVKLGFGTVPRPQHIFVAKEDDSCWYTLVDDKKILIYERALTGRIIGIEVNKKVETSYGEALKTDLHILADKPYIVRSGSDSYFSKGLLLSLDALTVEELSQPLTIAVSPGEKTIVFCSIYNPVTYSCVEMSWDGHRELDWDAISQRVSLKVNSLVRSKPVEPVGGVESVNTDTLIAQSDKYLENLNWTLKQGQEYLQENYGKRSRTQLTPNELQSFVYYLKSLA